MKQVKKLYLAILVVTITVCYEGNMQPAIIALVIFVFILLVIYDFLKDKKVREDTINYFSTAIDETLNSLHDVWNKYQKVIKDSHQQQGVIVDIKNKHIIPAEFRPMLPDDWQWNVTKLYPIPSVLLKNERTQIDKFCCSIIKIISLYKRIQDLGSGSYDANYLPELRTQWKSLVTEVLERGNPLKKHNKPLHRTPEARRP